MIPKSHVEERQVLGECTLQWSPRTPWDHLRSASKSAVSSQLQWAALTKGLDSWFPNFCSQIPNFWSMCIKVYLLVIYKMINMKRKLKRWDCHYSSKCFYFPCIPQWCRTFTSPRGVCVPLGRPQHWQRGFYFIPTWSPQSLVHRMHLKMLQWVTKDSNTPRDRIGTRNSGLLPTWDCQIQHSHHFKSFVQIWEGSREDTCFFFRLV